MASPRPRRRVATLAVGTLLVGLGARTALGHAEMMTVTPADGSTVQGSPADIVMTFNQHLDPARSNIRLVDAGGTVVVEGSTVDADGTTMRLALAGPLPAGAYTTRWTSFSAEDGEQDHGTTTFTVVAPIATDPSLAPSPSPSTTATIAAPSGGASAAPTVASMSDAIIPIVAALVVLAGLGIWLLRGRARAR